MTRAGDHLRPVDDAREPGVYRVVGTGDEITLLRVTDGDGRRVHSGDIRHVAAAEIASAFEPTADPDAGLTPVRSVRNWLQGLYWQFRKFA